MTSRKQLTEADPEPGLVAAYRDVLPRLKRLRGRSVDADDIAQESIVRVLERKNSLSLVHPLQYLLRTARNLLIDEHRRSETRVRGQFDAASDAPALLNHTIDPERILSGRQELAVVLAAVEALPPRCREAFMLRRFENLSHAAIARRMGITTRMVEMHIAEAMLKLGQALRSARNADK